ncbi:DDT domain-containing protein DDB_G0282237 [Cajanus cajan]|uniref:Bromodomain adjacent to zinc finger domain protein 1A n=1 Tax=Cajanus cajan TaxID=3821 RepID=A0A151SU97_CAJCA|nr:DDT domain-containing protein DDB_G0282237 [Cajanus cajan]KYP58312.1 Bromodomain adjacent to zinc finger domain protein 1A [Cajanus cajan]
MPLLRRKPFALAELPVDLKPDELVYQIRFTKEIFRDYHEYLKRLNLYRQRVWMCKVTGKTVLTYEEAMVSEQRATEKVQQIPKELMTTALRIIQYSMLPLKDLADFIAEKLQKRLFVGAELHGKKDDGVHPCKILKVIQKGVDKFCYEVAWLDKNKNISERAEVSAEDLVHKKPLFSRNILKSFIRESTYRNAPWVLHDELAKNHGISTDIPEELRGRVFFKDGLLICSKKRKNEESLEDSDGKRKKLVGAQVVDSGLEKENGRHKDEPIKYPIDDLLVKPSPDDPVFTDRPSPSRDFNIPMSCVGDLLMVWDFLTSFGKLLHLWPFSLEDFENAVCHKDSNVVLLVESHAALFRLLIKEDDECSSAVKKRKLKSKITMINWTEYLCNFLEMINIPELQHCEATIKRGHYGLVDASVKLEILCNLVNRTVGSAIFREKLDVIIEQRQALGATRREEALEKARRRREEKERLKAEAESNGYVNGHHMNGANVLTNNMHGIQNGEAQNGDVGEKSKIKIESSGQNDPLSGSGINHLNTASKKTPKKQNSELKEPMENGKELSRKESPKQLKGDKNPSEKNSEEQRKEYFEREMEKRIIRRSPLGKDRDYNRYWWFRRDGRIFVESCDSKEWGYYSSKEELDALMSSLNCKGERERALRKQLEKYYNKICLEFQKRSKDLMHKILDESVLRRSTRVRAPPRQNPANAFLRYVNKWKEE